MFFSQNKQNLWALNQKILVSSERVCNHQTPGCFFLRISKTYGLLIKRYCSEVCVSVTRIRRTYGLSIKRYRNFGQNKIWKYGNNIQNNGSILRPSDRVDIILVYWGGWWWWVIVVVGGCGGGRWCINPFSCQTHLSWVKLRLSLAWVCVVTKPDNKVWVQIQRGEGSDNVPPKSNCFISYCSLF